MSLGFQLNFDLNRNKTVTNKTAKSQIAAGLMASARQKNRKPNHKLRGSGLVN
jgi:hypothetical protein